MTDDTDDGAVLTEDQAPDPTLPDAGAGVDDRHREDTLPDTAMGRA